MTTHRYFALIVNNPAARSAWETAHARAIADAEPFAVQSYGARLIVIAERTAVVAIGDQGVVVGRLHPSQSESALRALDAEASGMALRTHGASLLRACWGSYVAFIAAIGEDSVHVLRSPFGDLGCYWAQSPFGVLIGSDIDLLRRFGGYSSKVSWSAVVRHLVASDLHGQQTCLEGLNELSGGERLTDKAGRHAVDTPWRIWDFVDRGVRMRGPDEAADCVRDAVQISVAAQARAHSKVLLRLSGGLDSSIVAASLAKTEAVCVAVTMVTRDRGGDERVHAQSVARHTGVTLTEVVRSTDMVDLAVSEARTLPRPTARAFAQASLYVARTLARQQGATAIFDGGGGDNMFAALQSPAPVADCLHRTGGWGHFWRTARSIGIAANTGTAHVARRAIWRAATRGPAYRWQADTRLLSPKACEMARGATDHPWLVPPRGVLPGSAAHIALLAGASSVVQSRDPQAAIPVCSPLITQPVAEACLSVPSWLWTQDGLDRAVARSAFRNVLPAGICDRRDKGLPDSFLMELIDVNFRQISSMLSDGVLASEGLIDTTALAEALHPPRLAKGGGYIRVMQLVDAEAWARSML
ncbi:asparagine synthase-related protein [Sphingomonas sp. R86520]|uniref:asparagine synthase-related protein n=1 Tax=Sphingomonas sp. R86520 TaxID=3093859 RepID=UPI0036D3878A